MSGHQPDDAADDELIARLSQIAAQADPVPEALFAAARTAFGLRDLDARVAELVHDSAVDPPATLVRGPDARLLSFEADDIAIECEVIVRGTRRDIIGQLVGGTATALQVRTPGAAVDIHVEEHGRFSVRDLPVGPFRLWCSLADGTTLVTSWTMV
jgi:hypothetical protein